MFAIEGENAFTRLSGVDPADVLCLYALFVFTVVSEFLFVESVLKVGGILTKRVR